MVIILERRTFCRNVTRQKHVAGRLNALTRKPQTIFGAALVVSVALHENLISFSQIWTHKINTYTFADRTASRSTSSEPIRKVVCCIGCRLWGGANRTWWWLQPSRLDTFSQKRQTVLGTALVVGVALKTTFLRLCFLWRPWLWTLLVLRSPGICWRVLQTYLPGCSSLEASRAQHFLLVQLEQPDKRIDARKISNSLNSTDHDRHTKLDKS